MSNAHTRFRSRLVRELRSPFPRSFMDGFKRACLGLLTTSSLLAAPGFEASIARVESRMQGRLGVYAMRGSTVRAYRAGERFAYCSSFKWVLGAAILKRVEEGSLRLDRLVDYEEKDLIPFSPVTQARVKEGKMPIADLCSATITVSDNTAANLLEPLAGGLPGMRKFVRGLGDEVTRFDRMEPELNSNLPGDPRDTTTPEAMARLLRSAMETQALSKTSRDQLLTWMKGSVTGAGRIRAGVPLGWTVAHKTGSGARGAINDVAVLHPPQGAPVYLCVFTDGDKSDTQAHEAAIAEATRLVLESLL